MHAGGRPEVSQAFAYRGTNSSPSDCGRNAGELNAGLIGVGGYLALIMVCLFCMVRIFRPGKVNGGNFCVLWRRRNIDAKSHGKTRFGVFEAHDA